MGANTSSAPAAEERERVRGAWPRLLLLIAKMGAFFIEENQKLDKKEYRLVKRSRQGDVLHCDKL